MENGDIIAGMFKVLSMISCKVLLLITLFIDQMEKPMQMFYCYQIGWEKKR